MNHVIVGDFKNGSKEFPKGRLASGAHAYKCIENVTNKGCNCHVTGEFSNGVKVGYVENHVLKTKDGKGKRENSDIGQSWFPKTWSDDDIRNAGTYVANNKEVWDETKRFGAGVYNGVRIGFYTDLQGQPTTLFPDNSQQPTKTGSEKVKRYED